MIVVVSCCLVKNRLAFFAFVKLGLERLVNKFLRLWQTCDNPSFPLSTFFQGFRLHKIDWHKTGRHTLTLTKKASHVIFHLLNAFIARRACCCCEFCRLHHVFCDFSVVVVLPICGCVWPSDAGMVGQFPHTWSAQVTGFVTETPLEHLQITKMNTGRILISFFLQFPLWQNLKSSCLWQGVCAACKKNVISWMNWISQSFGKRTNAAPEKMVTAWQDTQRQNVVCLLQGLKESWSFSSQNSRKKNLHFSRDVAFSCYIRQWLQSNRACVGADGDPLETEEILGSFFLSFFLLWLQTNSRNNLSQWIASNQMKSDHWELQPEHF